MPPIKTLSPGINARRISLADRRISLLLMRARGSAEKNWKRCSMNSRASVLTLRKAGDARQYAVQREKTLLVEDDAMSLHLDGGKLFTRLRTNGHRQHIPVINTSADAAMKEEALKVGATGCLIKPVDFKLLYKMLKVVMLSTMLMPETRR